MRGIERKEGEAYRSGLEGSEERAREAARTDAPAPAFAVSCPPLRVAGLPAE